MHLNKVTAQPSESAAAKSQHTLQDLECIIERGKSTFIEVADALYEIKSRKLYKNTHPTWEAYLKERWRFSRQHAHRLLQAREEAKMSPTGDKPKTERDARKRREAKKEGERKAPKTPSGLIVNLQDEISAFRDLLSRWEKFLSTADRLSVLREAVSLAENLISDLEEEKEAA